jgi:hypothetical protein
MTGERRARRIAGDRAERSAPAWALDSLIIPTYYMRHDAY